MIKAPEKLQFLEPYVNNLIHNSNTLPTRHHIIEFLSILSVVKFLPSDKSISIISMYSSILVPFLNDKLSITNVDIANQNNETELLLTTKTASFRHFLDPKYNNFIQQYENKVFFILDHNSDSSGSRFYFDGDLIDGFEHHQWYKYMRSHKHYGVKLDKEEMGYSWENW